MRSQLILTALLALALGGCVDKAQDAVLTFNEKVIVPVTQKAIAETHANAYQFQIGAHAIEPGYKLTFRGALVQAFEGEVTVRLIGVAADANFGTQGAAPSSPTPPPGSAASQPATQPSVP